MRPIRRRIFPLGPQILYGLLSGDQLMGDPGIAAFIKDTTGTKR